MYARADHLRSSEFVSSTCCLGEVAWQWLVWLTEHEGEQGGKDSKEYYTLSELPIAAQRT